MIPPAYSAARAVAVRLQPHFAHHHPSASHPGVSAIETIVDAAFWASLQREEGYEPRISLAYLAPGQSALPLTFERPIPLTPPALTRLAPAVERPGIHLGVWSEPGGLYVWGATRRLPPFCFVVEVVAPGLLVIKQSRGEELGKFVNLAVLQADQIKVIDQGAAAIPDCPDVLSSLLGLDSQSDSSHSVNILIQLAASMREHGRGGSLLVVPAESEGWRQSILHPITYSVAPSFAVLADLLRQHPEMSLDRTWLDSLRRAVEGIAGLTAVDGATVITDQYHLLAFGAKILRRSGSPQITQVMVTEPVEKAAPEIVEPSQLGGTRHLSAAQFVHDQRDAIALVASQDGRFTVLGWSRCEDKVHAHRIDALLL